MYGAVSQPDRSGIERGPTAALLSVSLMHRTCLIVSIRPSSSLVFIACSIGWRRLGTPLHHPSQKAEGGTVLAIQDPEREVAKALKELVDAGIRS